MNMFRRGDPQPTGHTWRQMTLGKLMRAGMMCRIRCDACGHEAMHSPIWLVTIGNSWFGDTLYDVAQPGVPPLRIAPRGDRKRAGWLRRLMFRRPQLSPSGRIEKGEMCQL